MRHTRCIITGLMKEISDCNIEIDKVKLAWASGFYDGEGSISCRALRLNNAPRLSLSLSQVELGPLKKFKRCLWGLGKIYGPMFHGANHIYRWETTGFERCQMGIILMWNELSDVKKEQAKKALTLYLERYSEK